MYYGTATIGSLLPDIDHPNSYLGRRTWGWLAPYPKRQPIARKIHRKFTHSFIFVGGVSSITTVSGFPIAALSLSVGMVSQQRSRGQGHRTERSHGFKRLGQAVKTALPNTPTKPATSYEHFLKGIK